jgi:proline dehydrogenase
MDSTPNYLAQSLADAKANNYAIGIKLVRGAYHPHELAAHNANGNSLSISPGPHPPVWETKPETDNCYNSCAKMLVDAIKADVSSESTTPSIGALFATHNWESANLILDELVKSGLAKEQGDGGVLTVGDEVTERVTIAHLYGTFLT